MKKTKNNHRFVFLIDKKRLEKLKEILNDVPVAIWIREMINEKLKEK